MTLNPTKVNKKYFTNQLITINNLSLIQALVVMDGLEGESNKVVESLDLEYPYEQCQLDLDQSWPELEQVAFGLVGSKIIKVANKQHNSAVVPHLVSMDLEDMSMQDQDLDFGDGGARTEAGGISVNNQFFWLTGGVPDAIGG